MTSRRQSGGSTPQRWDRHPGGGDQRRGEDRLGGGQYRPKNLVHGRYNAAVPHYRINTTRTPGDFSTIPACAQGARRISPSRGNSKNSRLAGYRERNRFTAPHGDTFDDHCGAARRASGLAARPPRTEGCLRPARRDHRCAGAAARGRRVALFTILGGPGILGRPLYQLTGCASLFTRTRWCSRRSRRPALSGALGRGCTFSPRTGGCGQFPWATPDDAALGRPRSGFDLGGAVTHDPVDARWR